MRAGDLHHLWRKLPKQARYVGVGGVCAVANNLLVLSFAGFGFGYAAAITLSMIPMSVIGYALHVTMTFDAKPSLAAFGRYCAALLASYPAALFTLFVFADLMSLPLTIATPAATIVMVVWNYAGANWAILWRARQGSSSRPRLSFGSDSQRPTDLIGRKLDFS